uniref:Uncharacterized protein LOC111111200 n=1 Tax=Crassostrea virginica TaxID=6565 RepID=A0A8B8BLB3_CRAVI|nr:uncharacterized protein LOC111111200 [Crassostrea virginica]
MIPLLFAILVIGGFLLETDTLRIETPSFLKTVNKTQCQTHGRDHKKLRCGQTDVYIKPECVCSFYNVYEATLYHGHSFCPDGAASDKVTQLKCSDCKKYSLNNNGPCINGGKLTCKGYEVAPEVTCQCPPNFEGHLCEIKIENIPRICNRISEPSPYDLENCNTTWKECVTYNRNELYAYKCEEANTSKDKQGLPPCLNTENTYLDKDKEIYRESSIFHSDKIIFCVFLILAFAAGTCTCLLQIK